MERFTEGSKTDAQPEWAGSEGEKGLQGSIWELGLGESEESYPERPDEADCIHYLRTGYCGYGSKCRFNHPRDRGKGRGSVRPGGREYPERAGQPVCQYYMRTGTCKFGASCKYHHPKQAGSSASPVSLNYYGYPLRPGEKECSYYVRTGQCKFGSTCKFHHPDHVAVQIPVGPVQAQVPQIPAAMNPPTLYPAGQSSPVPSAQQYGLVMRPTLFPSPYVGPYGPLLLPPGMVPFPGSWSPYPAPVSPVATSGAQPAVGPSSVSSVTQLSSSGVLYAGPYQPGQFSLGSSTSQKERSLPQRPGQAECQYYMKTGFCKYGTSCRYHHPLEVAAEKTDVVVLSPIGLPLRPNAPPCIHYTQHGVCKFGPACKYNHPIGSLSYSPSASSLADIPVAPYPVGSAIGTLAPSSSSSDLHPEVPLRLSKESILANVSSSPSISSESVGPIFSTGRAAPQSSSQLPGPGTNAASGSTDSSSSNNKEAST